MQNDSTSTLPVDLAALCGENTVSYCTRSDSLAATAIGTRSPSPPSTASTLALASPLSPFPALDSSDFIDDEGQGGSQSEEDCDTPPSKRRRTEQDEDRYRWWLDGTKRNAKTNVLRRYYRCADLDASGARCLARRLVAQEPSGRHPVVTYTKEHSHPPPPPPTRLAPAVAARAGEKMKDLPAGVAPSPRNTPTQRQLRNKNDEEDALLNIIQHLHDEWEHHRRLLESPSLLAANEREQEKDASRWQEEAATLSTHAPPLAALAPSSLLPATTALPSALCSRCKQAKANMQCTLLACLKCCTRDITSDCHVQLHCAGKVQAWRRPLLGKLDELLALPSYERPPLCVKYMGGSQPGMVCAVTPTRWAARPTSFYARRDAEPTEKKYLVVRVAEWCEAYWLP